jgi:hypothetical protein
MGKIRGFCDLDAWQESHRLVLMVYQYISSSDDLTSQSETVGRLLNGLIRSTENRL